MVEGVAEEDMTPLQKHVAFFDRNNDGVIYPWETFQGSFVSLIFIIILLLFIK